MSIHPQEHAPITQSPKQRRSDIAAPISLLAVAVMLGIGITAFSSTPWMSHEQASTVGLAIRGR